MTDKLKFRLFHPDDITGVMKLWKDESGWGEITEEQFFKWYVDTPFGECLTVIAANENGEIVAQQAFVPSIVRVSGVEVKALRFFAPILSKNLRLGTGSPMRDMFKFAMHAAVGKGYKLVYAFPAFVFFRITKFLKAPEINAEEPLNDALDCYLLEFGKFSEDCHSDYQVELIKTFSDEFNDLWRAAVTNFPIKCAIVRNSKWLQWKLGNRDSIAVRNLENKLIGYVSIDRKSSLIVDALARTKADLQIVIGSAIKFLKQTEELQISQIKIMETAITKDLIAKFCFQKADFKFAFWRYSLDKNISRQMLELESWYVMPND